MRIVRFLFTFVELKREKLKKIAALTMARNDDFFLRKWVEYYGRELGKENLYIYYDGEDQTIGDFCQGTNVYVHPKIGNQVVTAEKGRLKFLSERAASLFAEGYDLVIGADADEYIVVDPKLGVSLGEYLSSQEIDISLSPLGLDFGQKIGVEGDITDEIPFLQQGQHMVQAFSLFLLQGDVFILSEDSAVGLLRRSGKENAEAGMKAVRITARRRSHRYGHGGTDGKKAG